MHLSPNDRDVLNIKRTLDELLSAGLMTQLDYDNYIEKLKERVKERLVKILPEKAEKEKEGGDV